MNNPGDKYQPSNGTEGHQFWADWCCKCQRDKAMREGCDFDECDDDETCEIIGASFRGEAVEWRRMPSGEVKCIAFVEAGKPIPAPRCSKTADMFESPNAPAQGPGGSSPGPAGALGCAAKTTENK